MSSLDLDTALIKAAILFCISFCWARITPLSLCVRHHRCHPVKHLCSIRLWLFAMANCCFLQKITDILDMTTNEEVNQDGCNEGTFLEGVNTCSQWCFKIFYQIIESTLNSNSDFRTCYNTTISQLWWIHSKAIAFCQHAAPAPLSWPLAASVWPTSLHAKHATLSASSSSHRGLMSCP